MKAGRSSVSAYYVSCPHCDYTLTDPRTGSHVIGPDSVDTFRKAAPTSIAKGQIVVTCFGCDAQYVLPAVVARLAG